MLLNRHYEMEQFLEKMVRIFDAQRSNTVLFGCQGQPMDGHSALSNYNDITRDTKIFLMNDKVQRHRDFVQITCNRDCWCWNMESELVKLEKEKE